MTRIQSGFNSSYVECRGLILSFLRVPRVPSESEIKALLDALDSMAAIHLGAASECAQQNTVLACEATHVGPEGINSTTPVTTNSPGSKTSVGFSAVCKDAETELAAQLLTMSKEDIEAILEGLSSEIVEKSGDHLSTQPCLKSQQKNHLLLSQLNQLSAQDNANTPQKCSSLLDTPPSAPTALLLSPGGVSTSPPLAALPVPPVMGSSDAASSAHSASPVEALRTQSGTASNARTTVVIKNTGMSTQQQVKDTLDNMGFAGRYDYLYCPYNLSADRHGILGFAFVNALTPEIAQQLLSAVPTGIPGCSTEWCRRQGYAANVEAIRNMPINCRHPVTKKPLVDEDCLPFLFDIDQNGVATRRIFPEPSIKVGPLKPRDDNPGASTVPSTGLPRKIDPRAICVSDLPPLVDPAALQQMLVTTFSRACRFGEAVEDVSFGSTKNYAFVRFTSETSVERLFDRNDDSIPNKKVRLSSVMQRSKGGPKEEAFIPLDGSHGRLAKVKRAFEQRT